MPVQIGNGRGGYDPSLTIAEQLADVVEHIERRRQVALEPARAVVGIAAAAVSGAAAEVAKSPTAEANATLVAAQTELTTAQVALAKLAALPAAALEGSAAMNNLIQRLADLKTLAA